jgi:hypothetical protein
MAAGMLENHTLMPSSPSPVAALLFRNALLFVCLVLPWLNPFAISPSTAVMPLLLSWMCAACLGLLVLDLPWVHPTMRRSTAWVIGGLLTAVLCSLVMVPAVIDHALTLGLVAALTCMVVMARVGLHVAWQGNHLLRWVAVAWLFAACVSSVLGIMQYLGLARDLAPWVNQPMPGDAFANLRQRNQFATLTSIGLVAYFALLASRAQRKTITPGVMAWACLGLNVLAVGVACSVSRTGALQWITLSLLTACWAWRARRQSNGIQHALLVLALLAPVLVAVWSVFMPWLSSYLTGHMGASMILRVAGQAQDYGVCGSRSVLWTNMVHLIAQHPWLGWGWGETDFAHFMTAYPGMRFCDMLDNAHNLPLHLALEFGVPLALILMGMGGVWIVRRQPWNEQDTWRSMAWGVLWVMALHSLVEYPLWYGPFQMTAGLALGLLWCRLPASPPSSSITQAHVPSQASQLLAICVACALFLGCLYAAWDFNRVAQIYRAPEQRDAAYRDDPIRYASASWLFRNQAEFGKLTTQQVTADNAADLFDLAARVMHYSPEPRVVQRWIDSAKLLGQDKLADTLSERLHDVQADTHP